MFFGPRKLSLKFATVLFLVFTAVFSAFSQTKKTTSKKEPLVKKTSSVKETNSKSKVTKTTRAETERLAAAKRAEEARRQAAIDAERRRVAAVREAQQKKAAFERGLRNVTVENISSDVTTGEDLEIRRAAVNALGSRAGTVVVMETQTGKILTIVNQDWAIRQSFKPCSVIKLVTSVAGLNENLIDAGGNLARGGLGIGLDDALAYSNNAYFQRVGTGLGSQKMIDYARLLGLGEPTGLNATGETSGKLPFGNNNVRIYSHGDDFEVTPLQLAVMVTALSNGGRVVIPQIPRTEFEKTNFRGFYRRQVNLPTGSLQKVIPGMVGAAVYGTARNGVDSSLGIAGKTGSCIGQGSWVGLFASVAPIQNPRYAVIVITRGPNERGKFAAAVAGSVYNALRTRLTGKGTQTSKTPLQLKPQSKVNANQSQQIDDAKTEDSDDIGTIRKGKKGAEDEQETKPATQVVKPDKTDNKPLFPTIVIKPKSEEITRPRIVKKN